MTLRALLGAVLSLAVLALAGCAAPPGCARLGSGGAQYCLQPTAAAPAFELQQLVEVRVAGQTQTLVASLENAADGLQFVGLTPFGQKLVHLRFDNRDVTAPLLPDARLSPALLLGLQQLALWPADAVRRGLSSGLVLDETAQGRSLRAGEATLLTVDWDAAPWPHGQMTLDLRPAGLVLHIETLPAEGKP